MKIKELISVLQSIPHQDESITVEGREIVGIDWGYASCRIQTEKQKRTSEEGLPL